METPLLRAPLARLVTATLLFALGPAVLKLLTVRGAELGLAPGEITFCNVLFVGNLCAGLVTLFASGPRRVVRELVTVPPGVKGLLLLAALVSTIYPALLFTGLERSTVTNVVILSRFNGIVYVLLGWLLLRDVVRLSDAVAYTLIGSGVLVLLLASDMGTVDHGGDVFILLATVFFAFTEILSRKTLPHVSIQTYVFFRNFVSSAIFFTVATTWFGPEHFMGTFMGDLWIIMVVYALFAIVVAQVLWLRAVKTVASRAVAQVQLLNPVFSISFAFVLLGEVPMSTQWIVLGIIGLGMAVPYCWPGSRQPQTLHPLSIDTSLVGK